MVYLAFLLARYTVDFPVLDEWDFLPLMGKALDGNLTFQEMWAPHNEHRLFFGTLVRVAMARVSGWVLWHELVANMLLCLAVLGGVLRPVLRILKSTGSTVSGWVLPVFSLMIFSLGQAESWINGGTLPTFLHVAAVVWGISALATSPLTLACYLSGLFLGIVATYSYASGFFYWLVGIFILRSQGKAMVPWAIVGMLATWACISGYHKPAGHPDLQYALGHLWDYFYYVASYLGAPVAAFGKKFVHAPEHLGLPAIGLLRITRHLPFVAGLAGVTGFCYGVVVLAKKRRVAFALLVPYAAFALYAIGSALITGIGRVGFGPIQALSLRYVTISSLLWVAVAAVFSLLTAVPVGDGSRRSESAAAMLALIACLVVCNSVHGTVWFIKKSDYFAPAREELLHPQDLEMLRRIYPEPSVVEERVDILRRHHWPPFKEVVK